MNTIWGGTLAASIVLVCSLLRVVSCGIHQLRCTPSNVLRTYALATSGRRTWTRTARLSRSIQTKFDHAAQLEADLSVCGASHPNLGKTMNSEDDWCSLRRSISFFPRPAQARCPCLRPPRRPLLLHQMPPGRFIQARWENDLILP